MKKIGLLNIQHIDNYGANLISYSMEQEAGLATDHTAEVTTIRFLPDRKKSLKQANTLLNSIRMNGIAGIGKKISASFNRMNYKLRTGIRKTALFRLAKRLLKKGSPEQACADDKTLELKRLRAENFESFHSRVLHLSEPISIENIDKLDYDVIVVGSDVVWKPQRLLAKEENCAYFLTRVKKSAGIAYAASIGISDVKILGRLSKRYKAAVRRFSFVSMRERNAQKYIGELLPDTEVANCIDPVFLRTANEYEQLIAGIAPKHDAYVYVYLMGNNKEACRYAQKLAEQKGLKIVFHTNYSDIGFEGESSLSDGPLEFLSRIKNADYIVTDTFHGTAFSIIFHKRFITFTRGNMSVRLEDFLSHIDLKDRFVESTDDIGRLDAAIDYSRVDEVLGEWIAASKKWFSNAVNSALNNTSGE